MQTTQTMFASSRYVLLAGALACIFTGCRGGGNGGSIPEPDPTPEVTTGQVTFTPEWGTLPTSPVLRLHFYPAAGAVVNKDGDANGFSGELTAGAYKVLAYNTDATGVTFENTDNYDKAAVRVAAVQTPTRAGSLVGQPDKVYAMSVANLVVEKGGTTTRKAAVRSLVKPLSLNFTLEDATGIQSISGQLNGFLPSVSLITGLPDAASTAAASTTGMSFDVALSGSTGSGNLKCLGISNPQHGEAYQSKLMLNVTLNSGYVVEVGIDLSESVTNILAANGGTLPDKGTTDIQINIGSLTNMKFKATVTGWTSGDTMDGDVK